jgi:tetratricopeptide (TPR) repeat protein
LIAAFPEDAQALNVSARSHYGLGDQGQAVELWERCLGLSPDIGDAYFGLARAAYDEGDYETAAKVSRQGVANDPSDVRVQAVLAESLYRLRRLEELVAAMEEVLRRGGLSVEAAIPLGQAYLERNEYDKARRAFESVVATDEGNQRLRKQAHYGLATVHAMTGNAEQAQLHREAFRKLSAADLADDRVRIRNTDDLDAARAVAVQTHNDCAHLYARKGREADAEEMWRRAAALDLKDVESRTQLMLRYENTEREPEALQVCQQLRDIQPDNPDHWLNIALLSARLYRFEQALVAARKAVELNPDDPKYRRALQVIEAGR